MSELQSKKSEDKNNLSLKQRLGLLFQFKLRECFNVKNNEESLETEEDNEKDDLSIIEMFKCFIVLRWKSYLVQLFFGWAIGYFLLRLNQFSTIKSSQDFLLNFSDRLTSFVIFLPSMTFVCLGLLPTIGKSVKIILVQTMPDGREFGSSLLKNLVFIMYLSILTLVVSISLNTVLKFRDGELKVFYDTIYWEPTLCAITIALIFLSFVLLSEIILTIGVIHSVLRRDFDDFKKNYEMYASKVGNLEVTKTEFEEAIKAKTQEHLTASSFDLLETLKENNSKEE